MNAHLYRGCGHRAASTGRRWLVLALLGLAAAALAAPDPLTLHARRQTESAPGRGDWQAGEQVLNWDPARTAIIVCDMWDRHWCRGATERVAEMAPRMNALLQAARARGVLIIHAPSETMKFYAGTPPRLRAENAPAAPAPAGVNQWKSLNRGKEPPLPIDDSDGGCDDDPGCRQPQGAADYPWRRQIEALEIFPEDVVSDRGVEIFNVLQQRGIENVIVMGVHTNMCVLGRPFSIRAMVGLGKQVVLMRDLTDTMYNSRQQPYVSHFTGTDLVVAHIERHWCPTVTSADLLGGAPFRFAADQRPRVVLLIGEDEYKTWETLPAFASSQLLPRGFAVTTLHEERASKGRFPGLVPALRGADIVVVSVRRRALPTAELDALRAYLAAGRPLVGLRTASHAFTVREGEKREAGTAEWTQFDAEVLGGSYHGHHANGPVATLTAAPGAESNPLLAGIDLNGFVSRGSLYQVSPLAKGCDVVLRGAIAGQPSEPVAWTHRFGPAQARVFYTSLGHPEDFANPRFVRLLLNGLGWALDRPVPAPARPPA